MTKPTILHLILRRAPFELVACGKKKEEYRDIVPFWTKRFVNRDALGNPFFHYKRFDFVCFQLGYRSDAPRVYTEWKGIRTGAPNPDWTCGLFPPDNCYIIELGNLIPNSMIDFFTQQPVSCRQPIVFTGGNLNRYSYRAAREKRERFNRLSGFDPAAIFLRSADLLDPFKRLQNGLTVAQLFPVEDNRCACGCGMLLTSRRRYATDECSRWVNLLFEIIYGHTSTIGEILQWAQSDEWRCHNNTKNCGGVLEVDHIVGVKQGGGASWLSNFRLLCRPCHVDKTNRDFGRGKYSTDQSNNYKLFDPDNL